MRDHNLKLARRANRISQIEASVLLLDFGMSAFVWHVLYLMRYERMMDRQRGICRVVMVEIRIVVRRRN